MITARIIIAGGRDFDDNHLRRDYEYLTKSVDKVIHDLYEELNTDELINIQIVSGMAVGADFLGIKYAMEKQYPVHPEEPKFWIYGQEAGKCRNIAMAEYAIKADYPILCAFWDGKSKGTEHMIGTAQLYNIRTKIFPYDNLIDKETDNACSSYLKADEEDKVES